MKHSLILVFALFTVLIAQEDSRDSALSVWRQRRDEAPLRVRQEHEIRLARWAKRHYGSLDTTFSVGNLSAGSQFTLQTRYISFGDKLRIDSETGTVTFYGTPDSITGEFVRFFAAHWSHYVDSLKNEVERTKYLYDRALKMARQYRKEIDSLKEILKPGKGLNWHSLDSVRLHIVGVGGQNRVFFRVYRDSTGGKQRLGAAR